MPPRLPPARIMAAQANKGKVKQVAKTTHVESEIEEALETLLPEPDTSYASPPTWPIARPPQAHQPDSLRPVPQRLLSQLTRATMPSASVSYAQARARARRASDGDQSLNTMAQSPTLWSNTPAEGAYPDLDPATGLPMERRASDPGNEDPSLHLQRTISGLLRAPSPSSSASMFNFQLPGLPSIPPFSSGQGARRDMSSSSSNNDWIAWAPGWWSGNKSKVDETLSKEDQADTVEEEVEKHRRKCKCCPHTACGALVIY